MKLHSPPPPHEDSRLVLLIDEHWPQQPAARWVLFDNDCRPVSDGCGAASDWPTAGTLQVVLGGSQASLHDIRLPRGRRGSDPRVLAYAMEDVLLQPPDTQHLTVVHRQADGDAVRAAVLAVDRARLHAVLDALRAFGRLPHSLFSELELAPQQDEVWHLSLRPGTMILRRGVYSAVAFDAPIARTPLDGTLLAALAANEASGTRLVVHAETDADDVAQAIRQALPGTHVEHLGQQAWWAETAATSLLHGTFAPPAVASAIGRRVRLPLTLAAFSLVVVGLIEVGNVLWQRHLLASTESEMNRIFEATLPGIPAVLPLAQLERHRDDLRSNHGRLREDDLLARLAIFTQARSAHPDASITTLDYDRGRLVLEVEGIADDAASALSELLAQQQMATPGLPGTRSNIEIVPGAGK